MIESQRTSGGYCGLCHACGIYQGKTKQVAENLQKVIRTYGIDRVALKFVDWEPAFKHYAEFEKVLDGLVKLFGDCNGCFAGDGDPECAVRECCRQKAYVGCIECYDLDTCERLRERVLLQHCIINTLKAKKILLNRLSE